MITSEDVLNAPMVSVYCIDTLYVSNTPPPLPTAREFNNRGCPVHWGN